MIMYVFSFTFSLLLTTCSMHPAKNAHSRKPILPQKYDAYITLNGKKYILQQSAQDCQFGGMEHDHCVRHQGLVYEPFTSEKATQTDSDDDLCNRSFTWSMLGRSITSPTQFTPEQRSRGNSPLIFTPAQVALYIQEQDRKRPSQSNSFRLTTNQISPTQPIKPTADHDFES